MWKNYTQTRVYQQDGKGQKTEKVLQFQARPYEPGEDLTGIERAPMSSRPKTGDMIVTDKSKRRWLVSSDDFARGFVAA